VRHGLFFCGLILGGFHHKSMLWPYGHHYFDPIKDILNYGSPEKAKLGKLKEKEEGVSFKTALHELNVKRFDNALAEGHLTIIDSDHQKINFLHISIKTPTLISGGTYDIDKNTLTVKKIAEIRQSSRGNDIFISPSTKDIYISYVNIDKSTHASLIVNKVTLNSEGQAFLSPVYKSQGILPVYGIHQSGGILTEDHLGNLYLTVGDFQKGHLSKKGDMDYGKIMVRYKNSHRFDVYSSGHRNQQGLFFDQEKNLLFETEHGPQGGDEINIISKNKHYGWPHVTYGIAYGDDTEGELFSNKGGAFFGNHDGYEKPRFAFVPSIGIKAITKIPMTSFEFPNWCGNYLIASSTALYRVEIDRNRVVFVEPINQLGGFRDIKVSKTGIIIGSNGANELVVIKRKKGGRG
jgi:hypothetical protein